MSANTRLRPGLPDEIMAAMHFFARVRKSGGKVGEVDVSQCERLVMLAFDLLPAEWKAVCFDGEDDMAMIAVQMYALGLPLSQFADLKSGTILALRQRIYPGLEDDIGLAWA